MNRARDFIYLRVYFISGSEQMCLECFHNNLCSIFLYTLYTFKEFAYFSFKQILLFNYLSIILKYIYFYSIV